MPSSATDFRTIVTNIKKGDVAPVYLLMGEEPYYLDRIAGMLETNVIDEADRDFNQTTFYGAETAVDLLVAAAQRFPVMSDRQLVVLKEAQSMPQAKSQLDALSQYVEHPNPTTILVIIFKGDTLNATSQLMKAAGRNPDVVVFKSQKVKEHNLGGPIKDYCREKGITIDDKATAMLSEFIGNSLVSLFGQIDKLCVALGKDGKRITPDLVERNIGISKDFNNFELTSAIARKDYATCMRIVAHFASNPRQNPTAMTSALLFTFFQKLVICQFAPDKSDRSLMTLLQLKSPYALKDVKTAMPIYNAMQAIKAISAIRNFDTKSKGIGSYQKEYELLKELIFNIITA